MSVQSEITRIESAKTAIATAIEGKGVTVPDGTKLDGLAALVESIEAGGGVPGYQIVCGTYTPSEDVTSTINIYTTNTLKMSQSAFFPIKLACICFVCILPPGDDSSFVYPTPWMSFYACDKGAGYNCNSSNNSSNTLIANCLSHSKVGTNKYTLIVNLPASSSYPLKAGNSYLWLLFVPDGVEI